METPVYPISLVVFSANTLNPLISGITDPFISPRLRRLARRTCAMRVTEAHFLHRQPQDLFTIAKVVLLRPALGGSIWLKTAVIWTKYLLRTTMTFVVNI